ncbi:hypothetical protein XOCgx_1005 [Xanthomonas oryzae pv. oryzicola]|nr:hypothetical protein XOCgx_1005 [Xanthomonas oryzae pv. oryzicola]
MHRRQVFGHVSLLSSVDGPSAVRHCPAGYVASERSPHSGFLAPGTR